MGLVRYTWRHPEGHETTDEELFPFSDDYRALLLATVPVLKHKGTELLGVHVTNPLIHEHDWKRTANIGERAYYVCSHCHVEAWRKISLFHGPVGPYNRDDKFKAAKYETCRSPLKEMPPSTSLFK